jgi:hypothetical protein
MAKQIVRIQATFAAPVASTALLGPSDGYARIVAIRGVVETDNTAAARAEVVISRSATPLTAGSLYTEKALDRDDPFIFSQSIDALGSLVVAEPKNSNAMMSRDQLIDGAGMVVAVRAVGLVTGKVLNVALEVETEMVAATATTNAAFLSQALRFQQTGT